MSKYSVDEVADIKKKLEIQWWKCLAGTHRQKLMESQGEGASKRGWQTAAQCWLKGGHNTGDQALRCLALRAPAAGHLASPVGTNRGDGRLGQLLAARQDGGDGNHGEEPVPAVEPRLDGGLVPLGQRAEVRLALADELVDLDELLAQKSTDPPAIRVPPHHHRS